MPNCFQLTPKGATTPAHLDAIDGHICVHFQVECDPVKYHAYWYDVIGWRLAMGRTFPQIREYLVKQADEKEEFREHYMYLVRICDFLAENYSPDNWVEIGRR